MRTWRALIGALGPAAQTLALRKGASETAIVAAETLMNLKFPADYRAWLAIADGQEPHGDALFDPDSRMLPLDKVMEAWVFNSQFVIEEWDEPVEDDMQVRPFIWHKTRIPIAADSIGQPGPFIDLWPGPAGTVGQLITLVSECDFEVIATSLDDYFTRRASKR